MASLNAGNGYPPLVLLHGWGSSAAVFADFVPELRAFARVQTLELPAHGARWAEAFPSDTDALLEWLRDHVPANAVLVGWSLGGTLGLQLALRYPDHLAGLVTIATNPCFLRRPDWPCGMEQAAWEGFRRELLRDPHKQAARFAALQSRGDSQPRELARRLRAVASVRTESVQGLLLALDALGAADVRQQLVMLDVPLLCVFGEHDALVDVRVADECLRLQPQASVWLAPGAGHVPFLGQPAALAARIEDFLATRLGEPRHRAPEKHLVAASFGRAATGYETAAALQRSTGSQLLEALAPIDAHRILDLGSGTGHFAKQLATRFTGAQILAVDIAEGMTRHARDITDVQRIAWVCADAESLPLESASIDLVFSNLALQWCASPIPALREIARVLAPGGRAHIATLADDTLWELRAAWRAVDDGVHVNRFESVAALLDAVQASGLRLKDLRQRYLRVPYADVLVLARELRTLGAHNLNEGRAAGLAGRRSWRRLQDAYARLAAPDGSLPASWRVVRLELEKTGG